MRMFKKTVVYIGMGSNLGDRKKNLIRAVQAFSRLKKVRIVALSNIYRTEPVGYKKQSDFLNAVLKCQVTFPPLELLRKLRDIEQKMGLTPHKRWRPREIDLDILLFGRRVVRTSSLTIPHPRYHERRFVLVPLCELNPRGDPSCFKGVS